MLKAKGLYTFSNYLSSIPEGALLKANNVIIDRDGIIEPRRGITQYGTLGFNVTDISKQLLLYKDRILAHYQSSLAWDNGSGTFTNFTGSFVETETGLRIKYVESNGNLYVTTSEGVKKIATDSSSNLGSALISLAGPIKAITGIGECDYTQPVFPGYSKVAYRITWATKDINGNLIEGSPSPAIEIINQSPDECAFKLKFQVPNGITTDYFYRIYRTQIVSSNTFAGISDLDTGDEMRLVIEDSYVSGTEIIVTDTTPDSFRDQNTNLYTNEFSGEGILQANEPPPFAKDVALYKNAVFYSNTRLKHKLLFNLLGISDLQSFGGVQDSINITNISYSNPTTTITFSASPGLIVGQKIVILGSGAATLDGIRTVATAVGNTITVTADGTGATAADVSIYGSSLTISQGMTQNTYYFVGRPEIQDIRFDSKANMVDGGYFLIYSNENQNKYVIWMDKTGSTVAPNGVDTTGSIKIRVDLSTGGIVSAADVAEAVKNSIEAASFDFVISQSTDTLRFITANSGVATDAADGLVASGVISFTKIQDGQGEDVSQKFVRLSTFISAAQNIDDTARSLVKVITANSSEVVNAYYIFKPNDVPGQMLLEAKTLSTTAFSIQANSSSVGALFSPNLSTAQTSDNEQSPNRIYYSKQSQPESVPIVNYLVVGPRDKQIKRIIALRDSLFILKEEGIYRLTGESSTNYNVALFDNSANISAPDTATVLNNQIYCLTTQGVITISETGVSVISRPIENILSTIASPAFTNYKTICFGASYESDRSYLVWIPKNSTDTSAKRCLRFNTFTGTWTEWEVSAICAVVDPNINKLYVGASDANLVEIERKNLTRDDYADRQYNYTLSADAFKGNSIIEVPSNSLMKKGDVIRQTQYVTLSQVKRLANKLYLDAGVPSTVGNNNKLYYKNFDIAFGANLQDELEALIIQLNSDLGSSFNTSFSTSFTTFQTEFNDLVDDMNNSSLLVHSNYQSSSGTVEYELLLTGTLPSNRITVLTEEPFIEGPITLYKAISSEVVWAPISFGDPALLKHVRSSTVLFDVATLAFAKLEFNTDLSANFEGIDFLMEGDGSWGVFYYDSITWGGEGTNRPFRTLIPRQKQRCRFMRSRFEHTTAFYRYGILGISYVFEVTGERAYH